MPKGIPRGGALSQTPRAVYQRRVYWAKKMGRWQPLYLKRKTLYPTTKPTYSDLAWFVGFYEGEGWCHWSGDSLSVGIVQVNREPLEACQAFFGGTIYKEIRKRKEWQDIYHWQVRGFLAKRCLDCLLRYFRLSARRREQIQKVLDALDSRYLSRIERAQIHYDATKVSA